MLIYYSFMELSEHQFDKNKQFFAPLLHYINWSELQFNLISLDFIIHVTLIIYIEHK